MSDLQASGGPKMRFVKAQHQCFWPSSGLFSPADQFLMLPSCQHTLLVSGCQKKKHSTGRSWGTFGGSEVFKPSCAPVMPWRSFEHLLPLFQDWGGYMGLLPLAECHAFLPEGLSVGNNWNTTCSWDLNQASCSWPPSGDLTRHLRACAGGLGQIVPDPAFLFVVFLSSNDWRKWVNSAFRKTPLFKNCRSERLSLLFISKIEIYNPLSALLLTLVCHFYHVLLRIAIFVLNVAIATYF